MNELILTPSPIRRFFVLGLVGALSVILIYSAFTLDGAILARLVLFLCGVGASVGLWIIYRATNDYIILNENGLELASGITLATWNDIKKADRGMFAFKPAQGFVVFLNMSAPTLWRPGLVWRFGSRIGVGGVTNAPQAKAMADAISARLNAV